MEEQALVDTVFMIAAANLQVSPEHTVDKALKQLDLFNIGFKIFLHRRGEPRPRSCFVAQAGNPDARILCDLLPCLVVADDRRRAMERIVGLIEPLLVKEEAAHIGDYFAFRLDSAIADALDSSIGISDHQAKSPPFLPAKRVRVQPGHVPAVIVDEGRVSGLADDGANRRNVTEEQARVDISWENIAGDANRYRAFVFGKSGFNVAYIGRNKEAEAEVYILAGSEDL